MNGAYRQVGRPSSDAVDLLVVSSLLLLFELVLIRWISLNIRVVAYFSNIILIGCFLGFGVGCIVKSRRDLFPLFPFLSLLIVLLCRYLAAAGIDTPYESTEYIFGGSGKHNWLYVVPLVFSACAFSFITLGQRVALYMDRFAPLRGYSINVLGSLLGTLTLAALSFAYVSPTVWFVVCFLLAAWLLRGKGYVLLLCALPMVLSVLVVQGHQKHSFWSPYNKIQIQRIPPRQSGSYRLIANDDYHQLTLNLSEEWTSRVPVLEDWRRTYDFPYQAVAQPPEKVLVLGAGTGNDVAAALRNGAVSVDAVELDPLIYAIGRDSHPDLPYSDERVQVYVHDARYFLRKGEGTYDMIVMGWLDSHRLFSSLSNVRQDNFVYTVESMTQARAMLREGGTLALSFYVGKPWLGRKIFSMLQEAFGHEPAVYAYPSGAYGRDGQTFLVGREAASRAPVDLTGFVDLTEEYRQMAPVPHPTDDWPYLYYRDRKLHREYLVTIFILIALSAVMVFTVLPGGKLVQRDSIMFFFLGAAFLLLEVRNITTLALVYGSTWIVTSVVISLVLIMILFANFLVARLGSRLSDTLSWSLLLLSVLGALLWKERYLSSAGPLVSGAATTAVVSVAFLFAGIVFARAFSRTPVPSTALGFNILGAVVGGLAEYLSLTWGIRSLLWVALALYAAAWLLSSARRAGQPPLPESGGGEV